MLSLNFFWIANLWFEKKSWKILSCPWIVNGLKYKILSLEKTFNLNFRKLLKYIVLWLSSVSKTRWYYWKMYFARIRRKFLKIFRISSEWLQNKSFKTKRNCNISFLIILKTTIIIFGFEENFKMIFYFDWILLGIEDKIFTLNVKKIPKRYCPVLGLSMD